MTDGTESTGKKPESAGATVGRTRAQPTLKTIAKLSGLAVPTVSRALSDAPDISADTKLKVRRIADEIGYVPNRAGVRLRTGRTNVISLVLSTENDMMNYTARLISSIAGALRGTPFHLIITPYFPDEDPMKPVRYVVETGSADAVILNQIMPRDPRVAFLMERRFPFATHGRTVWSDSHPWADFDNRVFGRIGVEAMVARNRSNLVLIAPPWDQNYSIEMIEGSRAAADRAGVVLNVAEGVTSDGTMDEVRRYASRIIAADPTIDGFLCASTNASLSVVAGIEAEGFDVGSDVDIFAKEAVPLLKFFRSPILVAHEDVRTTGGFLARAAMEAIRDPSAPPLQQLDAPTSYS